MTAVMRSLLCRLCGDLTYQGEPNVPSHCPTCKQAAHWSVAEYHDILRHDRIFLRALQITPWTPEPEDDGA